MTDREYVPAPVLAREIGRSPATLARWRRQGKGPKGYFNVAEKPSRADDKSRREEELETPTSRIGTSKQEAQLADSILTHCEVPLTSGGR